MAVPNPMSIEELNSACIELCEWFKSRKITEAEACAIMGRMVAAVLGDHFDTDEKLQVALTVIVSGIIEDARVIMQARAIGGIPSGCALH